MEPAPDADKFIDALLAGTPPAAAAGALGALVNRASARLHTLARGQATAYKGQAEWPAWAQLQNAARALVLQASTCRDLTARLPADPEPTAPTADQPPQAPDANNADPSRPGGEPQASDQPSP